MKPTMMTYILEQESMANTILEQYPTNLPAKLTGKEWLVLATGSSLNAIKSAKYYMEHVADLRITVEEPFNYRYYEKISPHTDLVIGVSQSGESTSTIEAIDHIRKTNDIPTLSFTGKMESELAQLADDTVDIGCGQERVGYVTKGFTATVLTLMLTALHFGTQTGYISTEQENAELAMFRAATNAIPTVIAQTETFFEQFEREFIAAPRFTAIGYGPAVGTCKEIETKFQETIRVPSQGLDLEAFMHGPYLEVNPEHRIFFLETESIIKERLELLRAYEEKHTAYTYTVKFGNSTNPRTLVLPDVIDEWKAPYLLAIPFQILAHHIAEAKGNKLTERIYTDFGVSVKSKTKPGDYA
ncbi:SIS domain-containing protein [Listeria booriae]|uniref:SIS domain-containing protein n=1 Tax=Listeria booriae TaxID=1552123 RepID=UPI0016292B5C|nr:SIS domain-containing protein [Listeria booriae]MBC1285882.1 SIS domain-containing protein [Listeria booriae]